MNPDDILAGKPEALHSLRLAATIAGKTNVLALLDLVERLQKRAKWQGPYKRKDAMHLLWWMKRYMDGDDGDCDQALRILTDALQLDKWRANDGVGWWHDEEVEALRKKRDQLKAQVEKLQEDITEAKSEGVQLYAEQVYTMLDDVGAPPRKRSSHGALEDVPYRIKALAAQLEQERADVVAHLRAASKRCLSTKPSCHTYTGGMAAGWAKQIERGDHIGAAGRERT